MSERESKPRTVSADATPIAEPARTSLTKCTREWTLEYAIPVASSESGASNVGASSPAPVAKAKAAAACPDGNELERMGLTRALRASSLGRLGRSRRQISFKGPFTSAELRAKESNPRCPASRVFPPAAHIAIHRSSQIRPQSAIPLSSEAAVSRRLLLIGTSACEPLLGKPNGKLSLADVDRPGLNLEDAEAGEEADYCQRGQESAYNEGRDPMTGEDQEPKDEQHDRDQEISEVDHDMHFFSPCV
jgi:hypothetical protein